MAIRGRLRDGISSIVLSKKTTKKTTCAQATRMADELWTRETETVNGIDMKLSVIPWNGNNAMLKKRLCIIQNEKVNLNYLDSAEKYGVFYSVQFLLNYCSGATKVGEILYVLQIFTYIQTL